MRYYCFDNNGDTLDRYTIIDSTGDMLALSDNGLGVNTFAGNCVDNYMFVTFGYSWRRHNDVAKVTKNLLPELIRQFRDEKTIGELVKFSSLPNKIKAIARERFKPLSE